MQPVGTAVIGLGYWGPNMLRNFAQCPDMRLIAACDMREERLAMFRPMYSATEFTTKVEDIFRNPAIEAVSIATPLSTHFDLVKAALLAGKHVLVEKPLTQSSAQAAELIELAREKKLQLLVDHTFIYEDAVRQIRDYVTQGTIGKPLYFDSTRINLGLIQRDTNVLWDLAIHDLSILNHCKPLSDVKHVLAYGQKHHTDQVEMAHLHLEYADGFCAHIHVSWLSPVKIRQTLIGGTEKMITYNDNDPSEKVRLYDKGVTVTKEEQSFAMPVYRSGDVLIPRLKTVEPLKVLASHFAKCVRGEEQPLTPATNSKLIIEILELADRSMHDGHSVSRP